MATKKVSKKVAKSTKAVKSTRAPVEIDQGIVAAAKKEFAKDDISECAAMRNLAKRFKAKRPILLEKVLVDVLKKNQGTVRRQIQEGRSAA